MTGGNLSRRQLGTLVGAALLAPAAARPATTTSGVAWKLMWAPEASIGGLDAFETIEDDRAGSHPAGQPHIFPEGNNFRFTMHTVDRDTMTDRQRQEVTGTRTPTGYLRWLLGETWRVTCSMYIPSSLKASTTFTHISQTKRPGTGSLPITVTSLRRVDGVQTIEHKIIEGDVLVGRAPLNPLVASAVSFPGTGSWTAWASKSIAADLVAGANTIRLTATAAGGCPNLDYLEVLQ
ncbi:hypothetical protein ABZ815_48980 [Nonomuraea sp. NPDC047529]|uniref:hypothetical protein n=1 Tax=Nonomuraea sp. NPDC047529 TaxID=3155623 RepID=UPI0033E1814F